MIIVKYRVRCFHQLCNIIRILHTHTHACTYAGAFQGAETGHIRRYENITCAYLQLLEYCLFVPCSLHPACTDLGTHTCGGYPGSLGYIEKDAQTFAEWNVDMLKLDGCYSSPADYDTGYPNMSKALLDTRRPIVFSCSWPAYIKNVSHRECMQ